MPAKFPICLNLPETLKSFVDDAARAVRQEYRSSVRWKRLRCRKVEPLSDQPGETIFVLEIGHSVEFDWTWEGSVAFRPVEPDTFTGGINTTDDFMNVGGEINNSPGIWSGEIVEVDETNGRLFVSISDPEHKPCIGSFFVRPFEFLACLHDLFCHPKGADLKQLLNARLSASCGDIHPPVSEIPTSGLKELEHFWRHSWAILWGPPGTGKTYILGRQVAACMDDWTERILVVSTTNRATDAAAFAIGRAALGASSGSVERMKILRFGKGADWAEYQARGLESLLRGTEAELLLRVGELTRQLEEAGLSEERAQLRCQIQELRRRMKDSAFNLFVSSDVKVVVGTAFKTMTLLNNPAILAMIASDGSPFTTVVIDEAGLMSRATISALSLLASRRIVVVGDAKQLAPISKVSRILPTSQAIWLAGSGLSHLQCIQQVKSGVHLMREQHRMHPDISRVISCFQYEGVLLDAPGVLNRELNVPPVLNGQPRAIWYVLDEDGQDLPSIRAERGTGNRSWVRPATRDVLEKLFSDPELRQAKGLFITPFRAQARKIAAYFAGEQVHNWSAETVHARQGTEADIVIFDTVNAGSCGWSYDEWKRLVNVGLSRAREFVLLLASRAEMNEPYMQSLSEVLAPRILSKRGRNLTWIEVSAQVSFNVLPEITENPELLGHQLERRKSLRPLMTLEQQRLCGYKMDGGPRLVRGVAGSGKTIVLAHWLQKTVSDNPDTTVWAVYANQALKSLICNTITAAWKDAHPAVPVPWNRIHLWHVKDILRLLLPKVGISVSEDPFNYDEMAEAYLKKVPFEKIPPRCQAMFIDEAQDMGPSLLRLLSALVEPTDVENLRRRAVNIFYDNAQNIFRRKTPKWSALGLDMQGRSTIMKESFRSTRPITEYALNVLYRLQPPDGDSDHQELKRMGLIEETRRNGTPWWNVRFNQVQGPKPDYRKFTSLNSQIDGLVEQVIKWVRDEGVKPGDICIICNDRNFIGQVQVALAPPLQVINAAVATSPWQGEKYVTVITPHSFKGYDAEIVVVAGAERFIAKGEILPNNLYVAMTRARSLLNIFAYHRNNPNDQTSHLLSTIEQCLDCLLTSPEVEQTISNVEEFEEVLDRLGGSHREWFEKLWKHYRIQQEPIIASDKEILGQPLFWFRIDNRITACFGGQPPGPQILHKLEDHGIEIIHPGQELAP